MLRSPTGATNVADVEQIAAREKCSVRQVNMTISLAFLSPTLVKAAIDGRLPRDTSHSGSNQFRKRLPFTPVQG